MSIDNKDQVVLVVGSKVDILCHSGGSRPHATITWWIDDENLQGNIKFFKKLQLQNLKGTLNN